MNRLAPATSTIWSIPKRFPPQKQVRECKRHFEKDGFRYLELRIFVYESQEVEKEKEDTSRKLWSENIFFLISWNVKIDK